MIISFIILLICIHSCSCKDDCCEEADFCFKNDSPFPENFVTKCPVERLYPSFKLYNRGAREDGENITLEKIPDTFKAGKAVHLIIHGFWSSPTEWWVQDMKKAFLLKQDVNIVVVDWEGLASYLVYTYAAHLTPYVGAHLGKLMNAIRDSKGEDTYVWCIGHSLGAHVCHFAGKKCNKPIDRISALDPAGPNFKESPDITIGVNPASASFVDVIHTDKVFGTTRPLGHLDFYVNGGDKQPACFICTCSHGFAYKYFIQSIEINCYKASETCTDYSKMEGCQECTDCPLMGWADQSSKGGSDKSKTFYVKTSANAPYCGVDG